jgi:hypothetical protein
VILTGNDLHSASGYEQVSIVQLLANPEDYLNKKVRVKGYFKVQMVPALFLTEPSARMADLASAIELVEPSKIGEMSLSCNDKYIVINGVFLRQDFRYKVSEIISAHDAITLETCFEN